MGNVYVSILSFRKTHTYIHISIDTNKHTYAHIYTHILEI